MAAEGQFGARVVERRHHQTCRTVEPEPLPEYAAGVVVNLYAPALEVTAVDGLVALERAAVRLGRARARVPRVLWGGDDGDVAVNELPVGACSAEYDLLRAKRFSGVTAWDWFRQLRREEPDDVNFWRPSGRAFRARQPGDPLLCKLRAPRNVIAGGGSFVEARQLPVSQAWMAFERSNCVRNRTNCSPASSATAATPPAVRPATGSPGPLDGRHGFDTEPIRRHPPGIARGVRY